MLSLEWLYGQWGLILDLEWKWLWCMCQNENGITFMLLNFVILFCKRQLSCLNVLALDRKTILKVQDTVIWNFFSSKLCVDSVSLINALLVIKKNNYYKFLNKLYSKDYQFLESSVTWVSFYNLTFYTIF